MAVDPLFRDPNWNSSKIRLFLLRPLIVSPIDGPSPKAFRFMIVCSCNVLSDQDVRSAVVSADNTPVNAKQVYHCLGCSAECGRCARTIKSILDEALAAYSDTCIT